MELRDGHRCKAKDFEEWIRIKDICESLGYDVYRGRDNEDTYKGYPYILYDGIIQGNRNGTLDFYYMSISVEEFLLRAGYHNIKPEKNIKQLQWG